MWNHYGTVGPRSNNLVEGYNLKFNRYVATVHPNVLTQYLFVLNTSNF